MSTAREATLSFDCDFDERTAFEVEQKGFFEHGVVSLPSGEQVRVSFLESGSPGGQDLETEQRLGRN